MRISDFLSEADLEFCEVSLARSDAQVFNINIYPENGGALSADVLYVYDARNLHLDYPSFLQWRLPGPRGGVFNLCVVVSGGETRLPGVAAEQINLCVVDTALPFSELFNRLSHPLAEVVCYEEKLFRLDEAARSGAAPLESVIHAAGEILRNPLWCVSNDQYVLAQYPALDAIEGCSAEALVREVAETSILPDSVDLRPARFRGTGQEVGERVLGECRSLVLPIYIRGIEAGYLIAVAARGSFSKFDRRLLRRTARYVYEILFRERSVIDNAQIAYSGYLTQLLHNQIPSESALRRIAEKTRLKTGNHYFYIAVIKPCITESEVETQDLFNVAAHFRDTLAGRLYAIDGPSLVVLINQPRDVRLERSPFYESLRMTAGSLGQVVGISQRFTGLADTPQAYAQALTAAQIGVGIASSAIMIQVGEPVVFPYQNVMPLALIRQAASVSDVRKFVDPLITDLLQYDAKHNQDYTYSLYCYLTSLRNFAEAAKRMNLHKNTLVYRIHRIEEMFNTDLNERFNCFRLQLSFVILSYLNELDERY